jgi:hypothetical protein
MLLTILLSLLISLESQVKEQYNCSFIVYDSTFSEEEKISKLETLLTLKKLNTPYIRRIEFTKNNRAFYKTISNDVLVPNTSKHHVIYSMYHELGHVIDYRFEITKNLKWKEIKKELPFISDYAKTNDEELFGELVSYYLTDRIKVNENVENFLKQYL